MGELISIHPENPEERKIAKVVECLRQGGIIIYPTDTVYGFGCDLYNPKAIEKLCRLREVKPNKMHLSFICYDLSDISQYAKGITTPVFRVLKKALPGPFTFIMESSTSVPKIFDQKKKQVGIRVPAHNVPRQIVRQLGNPILTTSVKAQDEIVEYYTDPEDIFRVFGKQVDMVIDSGSGGNIPSTVIDCTDESFSVIREGIGDIEPYL